VLLPLESLLVDVLELTPSLLDSLELEVIGVLELEPSLLLLLELLKELLEVGPLLLLELDPTDELEL
jgi:hypothetical protein